MRSLLHLLVSWASNRIPSTVLTPPRSLTPVLHSSTLTLRIHFRLSAFQVMSRSTTQPPIEFPKIRSSPHLIYICDLHIHLSTWPSIPTILASSARKPTGSTCFNGGRRRISFVPLLVQVMHVNDIASERNSQSTHAEIVPPSNSKVDLIFTNPPRHQIPIRHWSTRVFPIVVKYGPRSR
jgi:hypothetical protein